MATTLKDVAQLAQVSIKTASNVVNDYPHVSDDMRRRVEMAIQQLDYRPNLVARALRSGRNHRSGLLALVVPGVDVPHMPGLVDAIVRRAAPLGLRFVIEPIGSSPKQRSPTGCSAADPGIDATLLIADPPIPDLVNKHVALGTPLVLLTSSADPRYDCVGLDATQAARDATDHLVRAGRRRIAAIGACPEEPGAAARTHAAGFRLAVRQAGLALPTGYLRSTAHHRPADGYAAGRELLSHDQLPDAIFCCSDRLAVGVIRAVTDAGLRVPEDIAVIGIGDGDEGHYSRPTLTTVAADPGFIAGKALDLVICRLAGRGDAPTQIIAPHVVVCRESTGPVG